MRSPTAARISRTVQRRFQFFVGDVEAVVGFRRRVERPDLHRRDPLVEQFLRQFAGAMQEAVEVVVDALPLGEPQLPVLCPAFSRI